MSSLFLWLTLIQARNKGSFAATPYRRGLGLPASSLCTR
jgi:hypothetical protein